jgi:predicted NBD/HSP70 family sugar kinase
VDSAKPSLDLLRSLTDSCVLRALMSSRRLTRAELAGQTGLSKPTVGESVRRLAAAGLVADTGARTPGGRGRGRVGSYYALADDIGVALVLSIAPSGVTAECVDSYGDVIARCDLGIDRPARPARVAAAIEAATTQVRDATRAPCRLAVVSAADPVDRGSGRLVHLPDAPFLIGELSPVELLSPYVSGEVIVDNDVNWAAQAERAASTAPLDNFAYLYLGEGLGCAIVSDGEVRRGHAGLAGEIAHLITAGTTGQAVPFTEVFAELGLRHSGSTAINVSALLDAAATATTNTALGQAISGVLAAIVALADPELIVIGGSWGSQPAVLDAIAAESQHHPRHVPHRAAALTAEPSLAGARGHAVARLRSAIVAMARPGSPGAGDDLARDDRGLGPATAIERV